MYKISEMAKKLNVSISTLRSWDKKGTLIPNRTKTNRRAYTHEQYLSMVSTSHHKSNQIDNSVILITGSGTLATCAVNFLKDKCKKIIVYSRDEHKQRVMRNKFRDIKCVRYIIGNIMDKDKLMSAMRNVDFCIHTAALKMIETGLYSADQVVKTNVIGSMNVAEVAIERGIKKALFISSDKACNPMNGLTYGLTKALAESAWLSYNNHSVRGGTSFVATRYGNIIDSNNSFYDILEEQKKSGKITVTDSDMYRFYFTIEEAMDLNVFAIEDSLGGEVYIPKLKSANIMTFVDAFAEGYPIKYTGQRGIEKISEEMIADYEMKYTYMCRDEINNREYYKIVPPYIREHNVGWDRYRPLENQIKTFKYSANSLDVEKLSIDDLKKMIKRGK